MQPFTELQPLMPPPGPLKCVWVRGADGRLERVWVADWQRDVDVSEAARNAHPVPQAG